MNAMLALLAIWSALHWIACFGKPSWVYTAKQANAASPVKTRGVRWVRSMAGFSRVMLMLADVSASS
jgi:hypothetical protein